MNATNNSQSVCPKCRTPLPAGLYEEADSICPGCGLVFFKFRAAQNASYRKALIEQSRPASTNLDWRTVLLAVPEPVSRERFFAGVAGFLLFAIWGWFIATLDYRTGEINNSFIHGPLLIFHEAGHVIFRLFGEFAMMLGGTLGQLLVPVILLVALLRNNRDALGASLALWFLGVSFLDIAPYVYDALDPRITLLNGATGEAGGHDWIYILREMGLLQRAQALGRMVYGIGIVTLGLSAVWAVALLRKQWRILSDRTKFSV